MNIGVFACSHFGVFVLEYFLKTKRELKVIAVDSNDFHNCNEKISELANKFNLEVLYSNNLYSEQTLNFLNRLNLGMIILAWWPYIIKPPLLDVPRIGYLNNHPSYLPYGRGKFSNFWAIVEQSPYGATMHLIDAGIDTGKIIAQQEVKVDWEDTGKTVYQKAEIACRELFEQNIEIVLVEEYTLKKQDDSKATNHYSNEIDAASEICLDKMYEGRELINLIRARTFKPYPSAFFYDEGTKYEVTIEIKKSEGEK